MYAFVLTDNTRHARLMSVRHFLLTDITSYAYFPLRYVSFLQEMGRKAKSKRLESKKQSRLNRVIKNKRGKLQRWDKERMDSAVKEYFARRIIPIDFPLEHYPVHIRYLNPLLRIE